MITPEGSRQLQSNQLASGRATNGPNQAENNLIITQSGVCNSSTVPPKKLSASQSAGKYNYLKKGFNGLVKKAVKTSPQNKLGGGLAKSIAKRNLPAASEPSKEQKTPSES